MTRAGGMLLAWLAIVVTATGHAGAAAAQRDSTNESMAAEHRTVLDRYCVTCHNQRSKISGCQSTAARHDRSRRRRRPCRDLGEGRPKAANRRDAAGRCAASRTGGVGPPRVVARERPGSGGRGIADPGRAPAVRRLTRTEYRNAVRDLLALEDLPKELDVDLLLPADNTIGFDTVAELLFVTPTLMEGYVTAARKIIARGHRGSDAAADCRYVSPAARAAAGRSVRGATARHAWRRADPPTLPARRRIPDQGRARRAPRASLTISR